MTPAAIVLSKVVVATAIAGLAEVVRRRTARPEPAYAMWATVLVALIIPAAVTIRIPIGIDFAAGSFSLGSLFGGPLFGAIVFIWLAGGGFVFLRQLRCLRLLERLVRFAAPAPASLSSRCSAIAGELEIRNCPAVVVADGAFSPFLWHPFAGQTRIVIPVELLVRFSEEAMDAVLRHELIHLRRRDAWRRRLEMWILAFWWWLPTAWIARCRLRELEELCTDEAVLRANPQGARAYARALLDTEEFLSCREVDDLLVVSAFARRESLKTRIARIVTRRPEALTRTSQVLLGGAVLALLSLGLLTAGIAPNSPAQVVAGHDRGRTAPDVLEAELPRWRAPVREQRRLLGLPSSEAVTVRSSDREIVLTWAGDEFFADLQTIRLVRISDDGVEPRLWRIVENPDRGLEDTRVSRREVDWIFAFLNLNSELIDRDGTRYSHPGWMRWSDLQEKEHKSCAGNVAA